MEREKRIKGKGFTSEKGMISVEMVLFLSMYVIFFSGLMILINQMIMQYRFQTAVMETAKEAARFSALDQDSGKTPYQLYRTFGDLQGMYEMGDEVYWMNNLSRASGGGAGPWFQMRFNSLMKDMDPDHVSDHSFSRDDWGNTAFSFQKSGIGEDGEITVTLNYRSKGLRIPFSENSYLLEWNGCCSATTRRWGD